LIDKPVNLRAYGPHQIEDEGSSVLVIGMDNPEVVVYSVSYAKVLYPAFKDCIEVVQACIKGVNGISGVPVFLDVLFRMAFQ
jgi:hypothetical protein